MRSSRFLVASVALAIAAVLFATCRRDVPVGTPVVAPDPTEEPRPAPRNRNVAPQDEPAPPSEPEVAESKPRVTTTAVFPKDAKIAQPRHTLRGRVIGSDGEPVADATATLVSCWLPRELVDDRVEVFPGQCRIDVLYPHVESTVTTDSTGEFALLYREGGGRRLYVEHADRLAAFVDGPTDAQTWEIRISEPPPSIEVRVVRASDGSPVAGAVVGLHQLWLDVYWLHAWASVPDPPGAEATTDIDGLCRFDGRTAGMATIRVTASGFAPVFGGRAEIPASGQTTHEIRLSEGYTLTGRVVDAETGAPIGGAEIRTDPASVNNETVAKADSGGRFRIEHVAVAQARSFSTVEARATGYATERSSAGYVDDADRNCELTFAMRRTARLRVRCVDPNGDPLADAIVAVSSSYLVTQKFGDVQAPRCSFSDDGSADSGDDGRAEIAGFHPGGDGMDLGVRFYVDGVPVLERTFPPLRPGETRDLGDVVLAPTLTLRGTVLDADGKPAAGATVVAAQNDPEDTDHGAIGTAVIERGGRRAECGPDGSFMLMGLSPGLWDLHATNSMTGPGRLQLGVDPRVGSVTLRLPKIVAVEGRVVDAKGTPVAAAFVAVMQEQFGLRTIESCATLADGRFHLPDFAADAPEIEVSVAPGKGEPAQTFKVRPGVPSTELRLR